MCTVFSFANLFVRSFDFLTQIVPDGCYKHSELRRLFQVNMFSPNNTLTAQNNVNGSLFCKVIDFVESQV